MTPPSPLHNSQPLVTRMWAKDPGLWSSSFDVQQKIRCRLGWLDALTFLNTHRHHIESLAQTIFKRFRHVVLLGMGGSSLCADLLQKVFPPSPLLSFHVLDTTNPYAIEALQAQLDLSETLFLVASKSGTTIEVDSLFRYFNQLLPKADHFMAITDANTPLAQTMATDHGFLPPMINPSDIGGRFSALSFFGLLPAVLVGAKLDSYAIALSNMIDSCHLLDETNPGLQLAMFLAQSLESHRDKLTLIMPPRYQPLADWIEQLIAESTGKDGIGLLPIVGEKGLPANSYPTDRCFVVYDQIDQPNETTTQWLSEINRRHPVLKLKLTDSHQLASEFFRWMFATAALGSLLKINPFDEPNVTLSKNMTRAMLDRPIDQWLPSTSQNLNSVMACLRTVKAPQYIALLAYLPQNNTTQQLLQLLQQTISRNCSAAVSYGFGPRFLHSTGQYHKGGPNHGQFIVLTTQCPTLAIPGQPYDFSTLHLAQAMGDIEALQTCGRAVVHCHSDLKPEMFLQKLLSEYSS